MQNFLLKAAFMAQLRLFLHALLGTEYPRTPAHPDYHEQPDVKVQHHSTVSAEETITKLHATVMQCSSF